MQLDDFDYSLPEDLIARFPTAERRGSRLLAVADGLSDFRFGDLPSLLREGDLLVFNDTRVIPARLVGRKSTGGHAELLIERVTGETRALAHVRSSKSPKPGGVIEFAGGVRAEVRGREDDLFDLEFSSRLMDFLDAHGDVPLPPYLGRDSVGEDRERYQTVYARDPGAVAAPTAGLHFDEAMLEETRAAGIAHAWVTLHVGAGTFQSLRHEDIAKNRLHSERVDVGEDCVELAKKTRASGGRVIAVGTTVVRSLECASTGGELRPYRGETELFIMPGYEFRSVDAMLTNFHLPRSSLMMLVAAFAGRERVLAAYAHAVRERYRFFSYGDSMFLTPEPAA